MESKNLYLIMQYQVPLILLFVLIKASSVFIYCWIWYDQKYGKKMQ